MRIALGDVGSTNDEGFTRAASGLALPFWVTARRQTGGRGRMGATWVSEPGNLYATYVAAADRLGPLNELPFVLGLAALTAIERLAPDAALRVKWPNDLLLDGAKVAGILAESRQMAGVGPVVVAGFGVNLIHAPPATRHPATSLAAAGHALEPDTLFDALAATLADGIATWRAEGFTSVREHWLARAHGIGRPIEVRLPAETLAGTFRGLDADGRLVLDTGAMTRRIAAGDVFFASDGGVDRIG